MWLKSIMSAKWVWDFIISQSAPVFFSGIVTMIKLFLSSIPTEYWAIAMAFFLIWYLIRFSLERKLALIKEYKSLMNPLGELSRKNSNCSKRIFFHVELQNKNLLRCWQNYYNLKSEDIDTIFNSLNAELDKVISNPYLLLNKNKSSSITKDFRYIAKETEILYDELNKMIKTEKASFDTNAIKKTFQDFIHALNIARNNNNFPEIKNEFIDGYFNPFEEPKQ